MPTINVLDATETPRAIELPNANGRQPAAGSRPVALSDEDLAALGPVNSAPAADETAATGINGLLKGILARLRNTLSVSISGTPTVNIGNTPNVTITGGTVSAEFTDTAIFGPVDETAPASDTASSGMNGRLQRIAQRLTSLIALVPSSLGAKTSANSFAVVLASDQAALSVTPPTTATSTREYSLANAIRVSFTSTSTTEATLPTLGASREIRFAASARCWVKWGATGLTAAAAEAASFVIEANSPEVVRIPSGATHYRVIRDTADGNLLMTPVA